MFLFYTGLVNSTLPSSDFYYIALGEGRYQPTIHTQGAWSALEQHMAPVGGLLTHALERHAPRPEMQLGRVTFDILGMIPAQISSITTQTLRPGRTIELIEATMSVGDRVVVRATAWRLSIQDTQEVAASEAAALPAPDECPPWGGMGRWGGGYIESVEFRAVPGSRPGAGAAWLQTPYGLVGGEESTALARFVGLVDTANGIGPRQGPEAWVFPNTDLSIHFFRAPELPWVGLSAQASWGATGLGLTTTTLYDVHGPVGQASQVLTIRPQPTKSQPAEPHNQA
ncbi:thioesterase family protein [Ornithinimicrobium sp. Arc0846-15]|nr:thioesterase family protein [Ornithinimicrobium laminariae]